MESSNGNLELTSDAEEEMDMNEVEIVGTALSRKETKIEAITTKILPSKQKVGDLKSPEITKLKFLDYIEYWRKEGRPWHLSHNGDKRKGLSRGSRKDQISLTQGRLNEKRKKENNDLKGVDMLTLTDEEKRTKD